MVCAASKENLSLGFPTRSETNRAVQQQSKARDMKFRIWKVDGFYYVAETKTLISCAVTAQLICAFISAYAKSRLSHDAALMVL